MPESELTQTELDAAAAWLKQAHPGFARHLLEMLKLHVSKGHDYGNEGDTFANVRTSEEFGLPAVTGVAIRMNDKMQRIKNFCRRGVLMHESVRDAFLDCANYGLIALCLLDEEEARENPATG